MGVVNKFFVLATRYEENPVGIISEKERFSFSKEGYFKLLSTILLEAYDRVDKIGSKKTKEGILPMRILQWQENYDSRVVYEFTYYEDGRRL